jgi:hypothetical protein
MGSVSTIYNGVRTWLAGRALMDVALSDRSTNGVQNKVLKAKFDELNSDLTDIENGLSINTFGTAVDLKGYSGAYYPTTDGYLHIGAHNGERVSCRINNAFVSSTSTDANKYNATLIFMRKGMSIGDISLTNADKVILEFLPLE